MTNEGCPDLPHFHVLYEKVGCGRCPSKTMVSASAIDALESVLPTLPSSWRGGVSVFDDDLGHKDEMPLVDSYVGYEIKLLGGLFPN